jgi:hypothetical protein
MSTCTRNSVQLQQLGERRTVRTMVKLCVNQRGFRTSYPLLLGCSASGKNSRLNLPS